MKALLDLFKQVTQEEEFDAIRIGLAPFPPGGLRPGRYRPARYHCGQNPGRDPLHACSETKHQEFTPARSFVFDTVKLEPGNTRWQRDLDASYNRFGDALKALGDLSGAKAQYEHGLEVTSRLAKQDPTNNGWQWDLCVSYDLLGCVLLAQGNLSEAKAQCLNGLAIVQKLAKQDPANAYWQYNLSTLFSDLGDIYRAEKDFDNALAEYRAALERAEVVERPLYRHRLSEGQRGSGRFKVLQHRPLYSAPVVTGTRYRRDISDSESGPARQICTNTQIWSGASERSSDCATRR